MKQGEDTFWNSALKKIFALIEKHIEVLQRKNGKENNTRTETHEITSMKQIAGWS